MNSYEVAKWLQSEATDEEVVETFIYLQKMRNNCNNEDVEIEKEDITEKNIKEIVCNLCNILMEIAFSKEICVNAWWKEEE